MSGPSADKMSFGNKLSLTISLVMSLSVWVWGILEFHKCGTGWLMSALKQLGVHIAAAVAYLAVVALLLALLDIWISKETSNRVGNFLNPLQDSGGIMMSCTVLLVTWLILKDGCRF